MTLFDTKDFYPADETDPTKLKYMLESWIDCARQQNEVSIFYRNLVVEIGEMFGEVAKTSDDGSIQSDVLALKVPELVAALIKQQTKPIGMQVRHTLELMEYRRLNPEP